MEDAPQNPEDFEKTIADIIAKAKAADTVDAAASVVIGAVIEQVRVYREDGPTLELFADKLSAARGEIVAAVAK